MSIQCNSTYIAIPSRDDILNEVRQIAADFSNLTPDQIQENHTFIEDLGWDSLDVVEFTMEIEEHFGVSVSDELAENVKTICDVTDGVLILLSQPQASS